MFTWTVFERIWAKTVHNLCVVTNIFFSNLSLRLSSFMLLLLRYFSEIKKKKGCLMDHFQILMKFWAFFFPAYFKKNFSTIFHCSIGSILLIMPHSNFPVVKKKKKSCDLLVNHVFVYGMIWWRKRTGRSCTVIFSTLYHFTLVAGVVPG